MQRRAIVVLGMHRSGTSAMSGLLYHAGIDLGPDLMLPAEDNPKGYFENQFITDCNDEIFRALGSSWDDPIPLNQDWHRDEAIAPLRDKIKTHIRDSFPADREIGFKDPRLCVLLPLWKEVFSELGIRPHFVLMLRNPVEIAASLRKRNGFSLEKSLVLWMKHLLAAERDTRGFPRAVIRFDDLLAEPEQTLASISSAFDISLTPAPGSSRESRASFVAPFLRHHTLLSDCAPYDLAENFYRALDLLPDGESEAVQIRLDSIREEFIVLSRLFYHEELKNSVRSLDRISGELASTSSRFDELAQKATGIENERDRARARLETIFGSRGWKMLSRYHRLKGFFLDRLGSDGR